MSYVMIASALEETLGVLLRAPHHSSCFESGTFCCKGFFVRCVSRLPHGLSDDLFGFCLGSLYGSHLDTSTEPH